MDFPNSTRPNWARKVFVFFFLIFPSEWKLWHDVMSVVLCWRCHGSDGQPLVISAMRHHGWQKANQWFWANGRDYEQYQKRPKCWYHRQWESQPWPFLNFTGFPDDMCVSNTDSVSVSPTWFCSNPCFQRSSACGGSGEFQTLISNQSQPANSPSCAHAFDNTTLFRNN